MIQSSVTILLTSAIVTIAMIGVPACKPSNSSQAAAPPAANPKVQPAAPPTEPSQSEVENLNDASLASAIDLEFLSADEVSILTRAQTIDRLSAVAKAKKRWKNDEEVLAKINNQWQMLMDHLKTVPSET